jgi:hypothetical protein
MRTTRFLTLALLLTSLSLVGCSKNKNPTSPLTGTPAGSGPQSTQVLSTLAAAPSAVEDGLADAATVASFDGTTGMLAAIQPLRFWRNITNVERSFDIVFSDSDLVTHEPMTATVTIHKTLTGTFNILTSLTALTNTVPADSSLTVVRKPLEDHWTRRVLLKRVPPDGDGDDERDGMTHHGDSEWRVAATSGVDVKSAGVTTQIMSVRVQSGPIDTTITDPLAFQKLRKVLHFSPDTTVTITVTTGRNNDIVVFQHFDRRTRLHNNGDNTYSGTWRTGFFFWGLRHFGINALSNGTLFDDQAPYDSEQWLFPYSLAPENLCAQYLP